MSGSVDRVLNELEAQHNEQAAAILPARVSNRATERLDGGRPREPHGHGVMPPCHHYHPNFNPWCPVEIFRTTRINSPETPLGSWADDGGTVARWMVPLGYV